MFVCINCSQTKDTTQLFLWTTCNHKYCEKCAANVINECLSLLNCIPVCKYPNCNRLLHIKHGSQIQSSLPSKYQINADAERFIKIEYLLCGYIRRQNRKLKHKIIPNEVNLLIYDYYNLIYATKKTCLDCQAAGYKVKQCQRCIGYGQYPTNCSKCHSTHPGIFKYTVNCHKCKGYGQILVFEAQCNKCDGDGEIVKECRKCNSSGIYQPRRQCQKCSGTGIWSNTGQCRKCDGTGVYKMEKRCNRCNRQGAYASSYNNGYGVIRACSCDDGIFRKSVTCNNCKGTGQWSSNGECHGCDGTGFKAEKQCFSCNGRGRQIKDCWKCNSCGIFRKFKKCIGCDGKKILHKQSQCDQCKATSTPVGYVNKRCVGCDGSGEIHYGCSTCSRQKYFIMLDFNQLCNKQLLCVKCNEYCPKNKIVYWPLCCHVICIKCVFTSIQNEITADKIPICPHSNCQQELLVGNLRLINKYYKYAWDGYRFEQRLDILFDRKDKFKCVNCSDWHENKLLLKCGNDDRHRVGAQCAVYWSCNHVFCDQCVIPFISDKINNDIIPVCMVKGCNQELLKADMNQFAARYISVCSRYESVYHLKHKLGILTDRKGKSQCSICYKWEFDSLLVLWSKCYHPYHKKCAQQYINNNLPSEKSLFNILKKETIPICFHKNCDKMLGIAHGRGFGITEHQTKLLHELIKKRQKSDCIVM